MNPGARLIGPALRLLPPIAIATSVLVVGAVLAVSGDTFGYDFAAYWLAGRHLLDGAPLYDGSVTAAVGYGVFLYPPPTAVLFAPLALVPMDVAAVVWVAGIVVATVAAIALLPVRPHVRWAVLLLAGILWPTAYAIKLGQVTPLLFLLFAAAWRWMDRPAWALGLASGLGTVLKLQPGLLFIWGMLRPRWTGTLAGVGVLLVLVLATLPIVTLGAWGDYLALLGRVGDPFDTPNNMAPGAVAAAMGLDLGTATALQGISTTLAMGFVVVTALRASVGASLLVTVLATQLMSPVLWEHYALILLLPIAWLLERGHWWVAVIPIALSVPLVGTTPAIAYPVAFWIVMVAVTGLGLRRMRWA